MSNETDNDDTVEIPALREGMLDEYGSLSDPEQLWLQWFYSLSAEDQQVVERCGENGVSVDAGNFEQMKARLLSEP